MFTAELVYHDRSRATSPEFAMLADAEAWLRMALRDSAVRRGRILEYGEPATVWQSSGLRHLSECAATHGQRVVHLNGQVYLAYVSELSGGYVFLTKHDGEVYTVGQFSCTCRDWQFNHSRGGCKHMLAVARLGLLPMPAGAPAAAEMQT